MLFIFKDCAKDRTNKYKSATTLLTDVMPINVYFVKFLRAADTY